MHAWLCFCILNRSGKIFANIGHVVACALSKRGWSNEPFPWLTEGKIRKRILEDPLSFVTAYNAGMDVMNSDSYSCLDPLQLKERFENDVPAIKKINEAQVSSGIESLRLAEKKKETDEEQALEEEFKVSPSIFSGLWRSITTTYGVSQKHVYVTRSFLGFKFGDRPSVQLRLITRVHARGGIFGDIIFAEGSAEPVIWSRVFRPESVMKRAQKVIDRLSPQPINGGEQDGAGNG